MKRVGSVMRIVNAQVLLVLRKLGAVFLYGLQTKDAVLLSDIFFFNSFLSDSLIPLFPSYL